MSEYRAPLKDMQFLVHEVLGLEQVNCLPAFREAGAELVDQILEEAARFANGVLSPLNWAGDRQGARLEAHGVSTAPGFRDAYLQFVQSGWNGLTAELEYDGQGLPRIVGTPVSEMWHASNMAFTLCPLLTQGAIEAIRLCGSEALRARFLPRMISGEWTGTMNLTEPQAGSDLAALRTKAIPDGDHYLVRGQKIFITYGDHDYTDNIIHLVLARTPDAPEGVKGISLFVVPKVLLNADGSLGAANDVRCVSIEHKLGIHGSPTCVMAYGDREGAIGYLVGEENRGLEYMFIMMNAARFAVGLEGVGIAERAYQQALAYARERVQGTPVGGKPGVRQSIFHHPDVRRMLMHMRARIEGARALAYYAAVRMDLADQHPDAEVRRGHQSCVDVLIPVIKGWSTEMAVEVASLGIQVHGGMGYVEETGAAQHLRDARITTIYEGTTGIQANDLVGRKFLRDRGQAMRSLIGEIECELAGLTQHAHPQVRAIVAAEQAALGELKRAGLWVLAVGAERPVEAYAGAWPFLKLAGNVLCGFVMTRAAAVAAARIAAETGDLAFYDAKIKTARFFADHILSECGGLALEITEGGASVMALDEGQF
jgi:alkylation response protein AidB-like acyl-CoA dehydrogenase